VLELSLERLAWQALALYGPPADIGRSFGSP
jgi:hypothetical protein